MPQYPITYLAIPLPHPDPAVRERRFHLANRAAGRLMKLGIVVFSPISHNYPVLMDAGLPTGIDYWQKFDFAFLRRSAGIVLITEDGWKDSRGIRLELSLAAKLRLPVVYLEPNWFDDEVSDELLLKKLDIHVESGSAGSVGARA